MIRTLLLLSLLLSCEGTIDPNVVNRDPINCNKDNISSACINTKEWTINFDSGNLPNRIMLKLFNNIYLNECNSSESYPFKTISTNPLKLVAESLPIPSEGYVDVQLLDCTLSVNNDGNTNNDQAFYKNSSVKFTSTRSTVTINL